MPRLEPIPEEEYNGKFQVRCDYETYLAWREFAEDYYNYEHALSKLLERADEYSGWG